jgi:hypothetical protein
MTRFRLDVSEQTGTATLWMVADTPCGYKMVLGWPDIDGVKEFAEMLLDIYYQRQRERGSPDENEGRNFSLN